MEDIYGRFSQKLGEADDVVPSVLILVVACYMQISEMFSLRPPASLLKCNLMR